MLDILLFIAIGKSPLKIKNIGKHWFGLKELDKFS